MSASRKGERPARPLGRRARTKRTREDADVSQTDSSSVGPGPFSLYGVEFEITPEPTADERAALLAALASVPNGHADPYGSVWRLAGLLENVESGGDAPRPAAAEGSPRSKRGASRA
jgi:hypothetical protein